MGYIRLKRALRLLAAGALIFFAPGPQDRRLWAAARAYSHFPKAVARSKGFAARAPLKPLSCLSCDPFYAPPVMLRLPFSPAIQKNIQIAEPVSEPKDASAEARHKKGQSLWDGAAPDFELEAFDRIGWLVSHPNPFVRSGVGKDLAALDRLLKDYPEELIEVHRLLLKDRFPSVRADAARHFDAALRAAGAEGLAALLPLYFGGAQDGEAEVRESMAGHLGLILNLAGEKRLELLPQIDRLLAGKKYPEAQIETAREFDQILESAGAAGRKKALPLFWRGLEEENPKVSREMAAHARRLFHYAGPERLDLARRMFPAAQKDAVVRGHLAHSLFASWQDEALQNDAQVIAETSKWVKDKDPRARFYAAALVKLRQMNFKPEEGGSALSGLARNPLHPPGSPARRFRRLPSPEVAPLRERYRRFKALFNNYSAFEGDLIDSRESVRRDAQDI